MAVHWSGRVLLLLEFNGASDEREDRHTSTDGDKTATWQEILRARPCTSPDGQLRHSGTYLHWHHRDEGSILEPVWQANLHLLGLTPEELAVLKRDLVALCLQELAGILRRRSSALQANFFCSAG